MPRAGVDAELEIVREAIGYIFKWSQSHTPAHRLLVTSDVLPDLFSKLAPDVWVQGHANAVAASPAGQAARVAVVDTTRAGGLALAAVATGLDSGEPFSADGRSAGEAIDGEAAGVDAVGA